VGGIGILSLFTQLGLTKSNSQALALLKQGGLYLDNKRITDSKLFITESLLQDCGVIVIALGVGKHTRDLFLLIEQLQPGTEVITETHPIDV